MTHIYQPYTYLMGWSKLNRWYYGAEYKLNYTGIANPSNLWVTYFTSSKIVDRYREVHGEPNVIQIRKTFLDKRCCIMWERKVLMRMHAAQDKRFLNLRHGAAYNEPGTKRPTKALSMMGDNNPSKRLDVREKLKWSKDRHERYKHFVGKYRWYHDTTNSRKCLIGTEPPGWIPGRGTNYIRANQFVTRLPS